MQKLPKNTQRGFTLIELLIVISIIGALVSIVLISLNNARERAQQAEFKSSAASFVTAAAIECEGSVGSESIANIDLTDVDAIDASSVTVSGTSTIDTSYILSDCGGGNFVVELSSVDGNCSVLAIREGIVAWGGDCQS